MKEETSQLTPQNKKIVREYCEYLYNNKLDNLGEMQKYL